MVKTPFLTGGGEMAALVRDHDWSATPLGPIACWSTPLRTAVQMVLASPLPTVLAWGPQLIALHNEAYRALLADKQIALGRPLLDVWAEVRDELGALFNRALAGEAIRTEGAPFTIYRHGRLEQGYFDYGLSPVRDEAGAIVGVLNVAIETTGRMLAAAELRESETHYRQIVEGADDFAIITTDAAGIIVSWNAGAERLLGYADEEVIGRSADIFFTPEDRGRGAPGHEMNRAQSDGRAINERWHLRKDGSRFWGSGLMMRLERGGGFLKIFRDRTAEHEAEARRGALVDLGDALRNLQDPADIAFAAAEILGRVLGVRRVGYGAIDHDAETLQVDRDWAAPGVTTLGGVISLRDYGSFIDSMKHGEMTVIGDVRLDPRTAEAADALERHDVRSFVNAPVIEQGRLVAVLYLNHAEIRDWAESDLSLIKEFADRTRTAVERARGEAALRESEARFSFLDRLGAETAALADADAVLATTTRMLAEHLHLSVCAYADMDADEDGFTIRGDWAAPGSQSIVGHYRLAEFGTLAVTKLGAGLPLVVNDNLRELAPEEAATFQDIGIAATICMPLVKEGRLTALMAIHDRVPRVWTEAELGLLREVTARSWAHVERVAALADLRDSEVRYRTLFETIESGFCVVEVDLDAPDGRIDYRVVEANPAFFRQTGFPETILHRWLRDAAPALEDHWFDTYGRIARSGIPERFEQGSEALGRWFDVYAFRVGTPDERRVAILFNDISLRRNAEKALHELNETLERQVADRTVELRQFRDIVDATASPICAFDTDHRLIAFNRAHCDEFRRISGFEPKLGDVFPDLFIPEQQPLMRALMDRALTGERFMVTQEFGRPEYGVPMWEISYTPLRDERGAIVGAFHLASDISERLLAEAELAVAQDALRQSQKMEAMGQLTGGVAHDFNNLLTPIVGALDMLQRKGLGGEREQRLIAGAAQSAERAKILVQRLLAFARRQPLQPVAVDIAKLVTGMADLVDSTTGPQIKVVVKVADDLPPAKADPNQLEMALLNLAVNARDAMPDGGTLMISACAGVAPSGTPSTLQPGQYVRVSVADTGTGMDEATLGRAVEPFFSTKGVGKGTGLGLSMVHGLASQLGGELTIHSKPGVGTNIELWLPQTEHVPDASATNPDPEPLKGTGTALLVDDEDIVRLSTADMLADLGYCVVEAASAEEALQMMEDGAHVDLLVTDHLMPGMTGTELGRILRAGRPDLPVLVVSGYADVDGVATDLPRLTKPFRKDELATSLAGLLPAKTPSC